MTEEDRAALLRALHVLEALVAGDKDAANTWLALLTPEEMGRAGGAALDVARSALLQAHGMEVEPTRAYVASMRRGFEQRSRSDG